MNTVNQKFHPVISTMAANSVPQEDPIMDIIAREATRQSQCIELIASENIVSQAVLAAQGSILTNKYAEGYPGRRYYGGCQVIDEAENLAIARAKDLFNCKFANVQPHSGSQANQAIFLALLNPGETILALNLNAGGHLTHGAPVNMSGKWFKVASYGVDPVTHRVDLDEVRILAQTHRPKLIIAGGSAYPRDWDFAAFREIADSVGAYLMVDMAHIAGLVAGGAHASPLPWAHVVSTTTHKTLRGPRGGLLLTNDAVIAKKIDSAIFPGLQGGPLMHVIAAKAIAFREALSPEFKAYAEAVVRNARLFADDLVARGFDLVSGGTDNHLLLVDLRSKSLTGTTVEIALGRIGITCNKNSIPLDPEKPTITSGVRFGTPATTTRGFGPSDYTKIADIIARLVEGLRSKGADGDLVLEADLRSEVADLTTKYPIK